MSTSIRQGQCDHCKIAWTWTRRIPLKSQTCACCGGPLAPVSYAKIEAGGYTWFTVEGYQQ